MIRDGGVHRRHTGDVDDHDASTIGADAAQELLGELPRALWVDQADDGQDEQALANLEHGRGEFANRILLLADDSFALLHEAHRHGAGDGVRRGFVSVEQAREILGILMVFREQRAREHVTEQEHDADDLVRLDAAGDDALRQVLGVRLQRLQCPGLQGLEVAVVDRRGFGEDLILRHGRQQMGLDDPADPFLAQLRPILYEVSDDLA